MTDKILTDEILNLHAETYYDIKRKVMGLYLTSSSLKTCASIARLSGDERLSGSLNLHAKTVEEIGISIKENINKFLDEENEMFAIIDEQLKELNDEVERVK